MAGVFADNQNALKNCAITEKPFQYKSERLFYMFILFF